MNRSNPLRSLAARCFRAAASCLYRVLSPSLCNRIALSPIGRMLSSWLAPEDTNIFDCDYGIRMALPREHAFYCGIAQMGRTNPLETDLLVRCLRKGDTVIEVGTYRDGWLALVASGIVGPSGRVIGFEPIPEFCRDFEKNVALNERRNITVEQLAVSDSEGTVTFQLAETGSSFVIDVNQTGPQLTVKTTSLDAYAAAHGIRDASFLIIDAEGAEPQVIRGARRLLEGPVRHLIVEVGDHLSALGSSPRQLVDSIAAFGFHPYFITRRGPKPFVPSGQSETLNIFFSRDRFD